MLSYISPLVSKTDFDSFESSSGKIHILRSILRKITSTNRF